MYRPQSPGRGGAEGQIIFRSRLKDVTSTRFSQLHASLLPWPLSQAHFVSHLPKDNECGATHLLAQPIYWRNPWRTCWRNPFAGETQLAQPAYHLSLLSPRAVPWLAYASPAEVQHHLQPRIKRMAGPSREAGL